MELENFEKLCHDIQGRTSDADFAAFRAEKNRIARFELFDKISCTDRVIPFLMLDYGKNLNEALEFKNLGNAKFKLGEWEDALEEYSKSYRLTPGKSRECAIILGNRSACLFHMKEYQAAIRDIDDAVDHFDPNTVHKLLLRRAKCYRDLRDYPKALEEFKRLREVVEKTTMPDDMKNQILKEVDANIKFAGDMIAKNVKKPSQVVKKGYNDDWRSGEVYSKNYKFDYNEQEGRYAVCTADIPVGELLLSETPFCAVVLEEYSHSHCQLCCKRSIAPLACEHCADVVFCSQQCKDEATFHVYECGILRSFWRTKASVTCHLSMRMMCCYPLEFFIKIRPDLERKMTHAEIDALPSRDYRKAYALVTHEDERTPQEMYHRSLMAKFLLNCLASKDYLKGHEDLRHYIGNLILHNIQVLQFNAHEVFELQKSPECPIGKTCFVGGAIFPVLALFNHSCDPATVRYFDGKRVHVRSVRPLKAGEQIGENYGPIYTETSIEERKETLRKQYKFECMCKPCVENWPLFKDMGNKDFIAFRCQNKSCRFVVKLKSDTDEFVVKCKKCSSKLKLFEPLSYLSKVDSVLEEAKALFKQNKVHHALELFLELLTKLDDFLQPPFQEYNICQQAIRRCYLERGSVFTMKKKKQEIFTDESYFM